MSELRHFRFWCQTVLPLVYDDALSYLEILEKVVWYINKLIDSDNEIIQDVDALKSDMQEVQKWIDSFDTAYAEQILRNYLATMIFVSINDQGYIVYDIPANWQQINFNTTGYDISMPMQPEYGHLVLSY